MCSASVLVFDSGFGGLSVASEIRSLMPEVKISYLSDSAVFPYGKLSEEHLKHRLQELLLKALRVECPDLLVVACNTATAVAIDYIREVLPVPVVGVVPAIKPAAKMTKTAVIGVLATQLTVDSKYLDVLIGAHAKDCVVIRQGSEVLVREAENKIKGVPPNLKLIEKEMDFINRSVHGRRLDCLVLGCTHFLLIKDELLKFVGEHISMIDSGAAIAAQVKRVLASLKPGSAGDGEAKNGASTPTTFYTTSPEIMSRTMLANVEQYLGQGTGCRLFTG